MILLCACLFAVGMACLIGALNLAARECTCDESEIEESLRTYQL